MTTTEKLDAVARLWLGEPPWDLTAERAVMAVHQLGKDLRGLFDPHDPTHTAPGLQREVLAAATLWARLCVEATGIAALAPEGDQRAAEIVTAIELEIRARLLRALEPVDVPRAYAAGDLDGFLESAARLALRGDVAETGAILAGGRP